MSRPEDFAAALMLQTQRARNAITLDEYCARYCSDEVKSVAPRYVADKGAFAHNRATYEELSAIGAMMKNDSARESQYTFFYFLAARGLASYAFTLKEEGLYTLGKFWALTEGNKLEEFVDKHLLPDKDKTKLLRLMETVDELYTVFVDKSFLPAIMLA